MEKIRKPKMIFTVGNDENRTIWVKKAQELIGEIGRSYCTKCGSDAMKISLTLKVECAKCPRTRLIQKTLKTKAKR